MKNLPPKLSQNVNKTVKKKVINWQQPARVLPVGGGGGVAICHDAPLVCIPLVGTIWEWVWPHSGCLPGTQQKREHADTATVAVTAATRRVSTDETFSLPEQRNYYCLAFVFLKYEWMSLHLRAHTLTSKHASLRPLESFTRSHINAGASVEGSDYYSLMYLKSLSISCSSPSSCSRSFSCLVNGTRAGSQACQANTPLSPPPPRSPCPRPSRRPPVQLCRSPQVSARSDVRHGDNMLARRRCSRANECGANLAVALAWDTAKALLLKKN